MAEIKRCKKCGKISSWNSYFNGYMCECGNIERRATTNADRIRAMSDEELAASNYIPCPYADDCCGECKYGWHEQAQTCEECKLEWLKQPAEDKT